MGQDISECCDMSHDARNAKRQMANDNMILANAGLDQLGKEQLVAMNAVWTAIFKQQQKLKQKGYREDIAQDLNPIELLNDPQKEN